jgi:hypothetical protein
MKFLTLKPLTKDLTGQKFGRLTVLGAVDRANGLQWLCRCECGNEKRVFGGALKRGLTRSCGCLNAELTRDRGKLFRTHGRTKTPEFRAWQGIWQRCENKKDKSYSDYGGRGIRVCERWETFEAFLSDMGDRPSAAHSLDRINVDGDYEPANCRWATIVEQNRNMRSNLSVTAFGKTGALAQFFKNPHCAEYQRARKLIKQGWKAEDAILCAKGESS